MAGNGRKMLTNFNIDLHNTCLARPAVLNLHHQLSRLISEMSESWNQLLVANRLYGNVININHFLVCCHMTGGNFYELLKVDQERFDFCKTGTFKAREKRGGMSWASFIL